MIVSELQNILGTSQPTLQIPLSDLHIQDDGSVIEFKDREDVALDALAERALAKHLGVAPTYLERCPGDLKAANLNYWLRQHKDAQAVLTMTSTGDLIDVYGPEKRVIPIPRVGQIITRVFEPEDEITVLHRDEKRFHIDIKTEQHVEVPGDGTDFRPEVGDITHGGLRLMIPADLSQEKPSLEPYLYRLVCSNGMSQMSDSAVIHLKGMTVPDILDEIESRAEEILGDLPATLGDYSSLADIPLNGNILQIIRSLGQEHNLSPRVIDKVMDAALQIAPEREPSLYDLAQTFTQVANGSVAYGTSIALQRLGGHIMELPQQLDNRCGTCAHILKG